MCGSHCTSKYSQQVPDYIPEILTLDQKVVKQQGVAVMFAFDAIVDCAIYITQINAKRRGSVPVIYSVRLGFKQIWFSKTREIFPN